VILATQPLSVLLPIQLRKIQTAGAKAKLHLRANNQAAKYQLLLKSKYHTMAQMMTKKEKLYLRQTMEVMAQAPQPASQLIVRGITFSRDLIGDRLFIAAPFFLKQQQQRLVSLQTLR